MLGRVSLTWGNGGRWWLSLHVVGVGSCFFFMFSLCMSELMKIFVVLLPLDDIYILLSLVRNDLRSSSYPSYKS